MIAPSIISVPWIEPLRVLARIGEEVGCLAFIGGGDHPLARWSYILREPVVTKIGHNHDQTDPFAGLQAQLDRYPFALDPNLGPFQGGWAGLLSYDLGRAFEVLPVPSDIDANNPAFNWPSLWLGLYDSLAIFDGQSCQAWALSWGLTKDGQHNPLLAQAKAQVVASAMRAHSPATPEFSTSNRSKSNGLVAKMARPLVEDQFERAISYIKAGDIFQANISARFSGVLGQGDTPLNVFLRLMARHPSPFAAYLRLKDRAVVSHSPERFLSRRFDGQLETRPIKGTAARHEDVDLDHKSAETLLKSAKDRAENLMIVDLMRNDMARVCLPGSIKVPRLCTLESFSTVHHLVSEIVGQQKPGLGFFDALKSCFPPGSITGAPKIRAMEIICELENELRGPWCGSMIWVGFDGGADSNVLIRTAACHLNHGHWQIDARAGAGIVADSTPRKEYEEILMKVRAVRVATQDGLTF
ncbi:anthranilate synthase component I family protein [Candidatus Phycosocius spiralis]|uniref:Aminodeoxychorismate synthase component I n=1 Tax=Candidatus Phycosocius spiralis TaxID=2815099 RepID=A0ABQ4PVH9_9PROT|nr:anthranilate synthase component I family protein [Candidatus Phycosocius spiralis]GIU67019.1 aminodeoxychorismate synthase component I [Candidatus Phycosocius spiralis]